MPDAHCRVVLLQIFLASLRRKIPTIWDFIRPEKGTFFGRKRPLLCGGSVLLSRHELCRIYALFWSDFDADFYADIEDFVQILC